MPHWIPEGWPAVTPRLVCDDPLALVEFLRHVFGAVGDYREDAPTVLHIGGSTVMVSGAAAREAAPAFLYVYVPDADAAYRRALALGAVSLEAPLETPYGDRRAMVQDRWGNRWQIATHSGAFR